MVVCGSSVVACGSVVVVCDSSVLACGSVVGLERGDGDAVTEVERETELWRGAVEGLAVGYSFSCSQARATTSKATPSSARKQRQALASLEALQPKPFFSLTAGFTPRCRCRPRRGCWGGEGSSRSQLLS